MKFKNRLIMSSILAVLFANCFLVNFSSGNPMPPPLQDSQNLMEFDFPLNGTVELVVFDHFNLAKFIWEDYERLYVSSDFHHDSNVLKLEPNYLNCTYRNITFSANNFGIDVQKIERFLLQEVFWWHVFNGTTTLTRAIHREVVLDEKYDPIINITNLNVTTEKLPVTFDMYAREYNDPPDLPNDSPEEIGVLKLWLKAVVITLGVIAGIILWLVWVNCISVEEKPKSKEEKSKDKQKDNETNFCHECGHLLQKGGGPSDQ